VHCGVQHMFVAVLHSCPPGHVQLPPQPSELGPQAPVQLGVHAVQPEPVMQVPPHPSAEPQGMPAQVGVQELVHLPLVQT
jgi:hypothetical protein